MEVNNFDIIKPLLNFSNKDDFYFVQIIKRKKDQEDGTVCQSVKVIKTYYVSSLEYLDKISDEIISLCNVFNARAYIKLNKLNYKQVSLKCLQLIADAITNENFNESKNVFDSACGQCGACDKNKRWIVDVDTTDSVENSYVIETINKCQPYDTEKIVTRIPTVHGYHYITKQFDLKTFNEFYNNSIDIHKNNPTLLYFNKKH